MTIYDQWPVLSLEAEMIYATAQRGLAWPVVEEMELWQIAAALGIHRIETVKDNQEKAIIEEKRAYWEETGEARTAYMQGYAQRRAESKRRRAEERAKGKQN